MLTLQADEAEEGDPGDQGAERAGKASSGGKGSGCAGRENVIFLSRSMIFQFKYLNLKISIFEI